MIDLEIGDTFEETDDDGKVTKYRVTDKETQGMTTIIATETVKDDD